MKSDIVYLKLNQNSQITNTRITLQDVGEIYSPDSALSKSIGEIVLYTVENDQEPQTIVFSAMKVIELIQRQRTGLQVENIGEPDFIVEYKPPSKPKKAWEITKTVFVSLIVFFGAAFTIMTFNTDVSVGDVFSMLYELVMGTQQTKGSILEITYSVGIAIGILGFYNHFSKKKECLDPTPLHIEMRSYEQQMNQAIIKSASRDNQEKVALK